MTITTERVQVPETIAQPPSSPRKSRVPVVLGWAAVIAGLTAAIVLAVPVLTPDSSSPRIDTGRPVIDPVSQLALYGTGPLANTAGSPYRGMSADAAEHWSQSQVSGISANYYPHGYDYNADASNSTGSLYQGMSPDAAEHWSQSESSAVSPYQGMSPDAAEHWSQSESNAASPYQGMPPDAAEHWSQSQTTVAPSSNG